MIIFGDNRFLIEFAVFDDIEENVEFFF